jgi:NAD(P)H-hydrate epimerase
LPVVVDADGLGAFARAGVEPSFASDRVVLTPHPGELARLAGTTAADVQDRRFELAPELASRWNVVLMLKGSPSLIAVPDGRVFINASGDDALARGGSGDVLTGLIAGLLAQGMTALDAALLGAYLHGMAGTLAAEGTSTRGVLVREIAAGIGPAFVALEKEASAIAELRERVWPLDGGS